MGKALNHKGELIDIPPVDPAKVAAAKARASARRVERDKSAFAAKAQTALAATDHWAASDYDKPMSDARKAYRAALRSIVRNPDPSQPFPVKPA